MDKFIGFSQEEINRVAAEKSRKAPDGMKQAFRSQHVGIRRMPDKWSKPMETNRTTRQQQLPARKVSPAITAAATIANVAANTKNTNKQTAAVASKNSNNNNNNIHVAAAEANTTELSMEDINLDKSMSKSIEDALFFKPHKQTTPPNGFDHKTASPNDSSILKLPNLDGNGNANASSSISSNDDSSILPSQRCDMTPNTLLNTDSPFKGISLKDFEVHRKMIQEQNRQKKELLYKAIEQHSQKTAAEAKKIEEIKTELAKLDNDLAVDVAILRKQIDNACINFANIEKSYMKIEQQFLKAKIDLHNAAEKKELLTEHLCTVIAHNEDRKAQKLSELMEKVGLTDTNDYEPPTVTNAVDK